MALKKAPFGQNVVEQMQKSNELLVEAVKSVASAIDGNREGVIYGFHIDGNEKNPAKKVSYLKDAIGMTPAHMDYDNDVFDYGSWEGAFFMPRPCMLNADGTVAYYLNENDYSQKAAGGASDISNSAFNGNAMMEWGREGKQIWMKIKPDRNPKSASVYIADHKADADFHAYPFINNQGKLTDHFYTAIYNSIEIDSKFRSLSIDQKLAQNYTAADELAKAKANNPGSEVLWTTEQYSEVLLVQMLLILMGKSTNTQLTFGNGVMSTYVNDASVDYGMVHPGTLNGKGLFYGKNDGATAVKVFGMENWYGNQWRRVLGWIIKNGIQMVKLTNTTADGSQVNEYNFTGDGYIAVGATPEGTSGGFITDMLFSEYGMFPHIINGSDSTDYCDGHWFNNGIVAVALRGGDCNYARRVGAFCSSSNDDAGGRYWGICAALSCKSLS